MRFNVEVMFCPPRNDRTLLPSLKMGAESLRDRGYRDDERVTREMMEGFDASQLICAYSRIVTEPVTEVVQT